VTPELILYALAAAGLVFWLRSILGTRHGDERERPNPFTAPSPETPNAPITDSEDAIGLSMADARPVLPRNVSIVSGDVELALSELSQKEADFDISKFSMAAQDAFALIVECFAEGDRDTLKNLVEPPVYQAFDAAITAREQSGETMKTEIHAVRKAEILEAKSDERVAYITIRFVADETCVIRAKDGSIISGDPDRITEMNDIWTFARPLRSRDPAWLLHQTRDGDVVEEHRTPIPDSI